MGRQYPSVGWQRFAAWKSVARGNDGVFIPVGICQVAEKRRRGFQPRSLHQPSTLKEASRYRHGGCAYPRTTPLEAASTSSPTHQNLLCEATASMISKRLMRLEIMEVSALRPRTAC
jgi:hypothetical protein